MWLRRKIYLVIPGVILFLTGIKLGSVIQWDSKSVQPVQEQTTVETQVQGISETERYIVPASNDISRLRVDEQENISIYELRNEAVVNIITETIAYNWFFEPVPQSGDSGSGTIIDVHGHVLTNHHVIENASKIYITLADGSRYEGKVVGSDTENDLAILSFDPGGKELTVIPLGNSSNLKVGQKVLAIGNPFALERTLTTGIISGLGRPVRTRNKLIISNMIQTDASINMGNSGGPLLNSSGHLIGVNTIIYSLSGGSLGIGFAIPVDTAKRVIPDLIQFGTVQRGWIDIVPRQLFAELVQYAKLPVGKGILVSQVISGGNADKGGLRGGSKKQAVRYGNTIIYLGGDIIVEVDGMAVGSIANLYEALEDNKPGEEVSLVYMRNKQRRETKIILSERPENFQWD